ncbi:MAG TPA: ABC transporter ATP-binding protein [Verrucomicrobiae bacterium]|jgi:lipoprotein-releasing system ATP-binding protein|nr:ABC transporter ATP-binding protein [Verrucomicrobiae bacterium]
MNERGPLFSTYELTKDFDSPAGELQILKGVNFTLNAADMVYILGRSGSGKTTFLNILGGLDHPTSGKVLFEGEDITQMNERQLARVRNKRIGFIFQFYHLLPELTLYENVLLPSLIAGRPEHKWAKECLRKVKLFSRADHYPFELSGGEKQRAAIARALINRPSVVLCDEPTGNLDEETAAAVSALMDDLNRKEGQAFIIVTHDESMASRKHDVYRLVDGVLMKQNRGPVSIEKMP